MKLRTTCRSCNEFITFKESVSTRPDLEQTRGELVKLNCQNCGSNQKTHVNDIEAYENKELLLIAVLVGIIITAILLFLLGLIGTISIGVPILIWQQHTSSIRNFNVYRMTRS